MSREQRPVAFLETAAWMYNQLEEWYDEHLEATFGEIVTQARHHRLKLTGEAIALMINGRSEGCQLETPTCAQCGQAMKFVDYRERTVGGLDGDTTLSRAHYVCPRCKGETFPPLDRQLQLCLDRWSEGAARVETRLRLQSKSFDRAAESYTDAVGQSISGNSVGRITEGWGRQVEVQRATEAEQASAPAQRGESSTTRRVTKQGAIAGAANISTDGGMMLIRGKGGRELKMAVILAVDIQPAEERLAKEGEPSRRAAHPVARLTDHSYQVGLWDADTMTRYQYAERLRRGIDHC